MSIRIIGNAEQDYYSQLAADSAANLTRSYAEQYASSPQVAAFIAANKARYPTLTPGAAVALGQAGLGPDSPQSQQLAQLTAQRKAKKGWNLGRIAGDVIGGVGKAAGYLNPFTDAAMGSDLKPLVRGTTTVLNTGMDVIQANTRLIARDISQHGIAGGAARSIPRFFSPAYATLSAAPQSTTYQAARSLLSGEGTQLGSGYLPGGESYETADQISRNVYDIDGHAGTIGRIIARTITEPGTAPYNALSNITDFAYSWYLDPAAAVGKEIGAAREARSLISSTDLGREAGLLRSSSRWTTDDAAVRAFGTMDKRGQAFIRAAAAETDTLATMQKFGLPLILARKFADTTSEPEALAVYLDNFQAGILRKTPNTPSKLAATATESDRSIRLLGSFPRESQVYRGNLDQAASQLIAHARNARMGDKAISPYVDMLARVENNQQLDGVFKDLFNDIDNRIAGEVDDAGNVISTGRPLTVGQKVYAPNLTSAERGEVMSIGTRTQVGKEFDRAVSSAPREIPYEETYATVRMNRAGVDYFEDIPVADLSVHLPFTRVRSVKLDTSEVLNDLVGELATNTPRTGVLVGGDIIDLAHAGPLAEHLTGVLELPSIREIRRLTSTYGRALNNPALKWAPSAADAFMRVWRATHLLTGASIVRNIGEAWARMGASGLVSLSQHPINTIATIIGKRGSDADNLLSASDELLQLVGHSSGAWFDRTVQANSQVLRASDPKFASQWADRLVNLHHDPLARRLAGGWDGTESIALTGNHLDDAKQWFWEQRIPELKASVPKSHQPGYFSSRAASDAYVDSVASQLTHLARDDAQILEVVGKGTVTRPMTREEFVRSYTGPGDPDAAFSSLTPDAHPTISPPAFTRANGLTINPDLTSYLTSRVGQPEFPTWLKAPRELSDTARKKADGIVSTLFRVLWDKPTDNLVIIPTFKRFYAQHLPETIPHMTREAQEEMVKWAQRAGYTRSDLRDLASAMLKGTGDLSFAEADAVTKLHALDSSKDLLYEFHAKSQFGDITRHFFPFFDAWKDMIQTWAKLTARNPAIPRKLQIAINAARGNDIDPDSGWFHVDPQTGEEVFSFPGGKWVTQHTIGAPIGLTGRVQGLNMFSSTPLMPGLGPIAQIPLSHVIPDRPDTRWAKDMAIPFGMPTLESTPGGGFRSQIAGSLLPPWFQKIATGITADATNDRNYMNAVKDAASYLMSTGKYDARNPVDMQAMEDKAMSLAKSIWWLRGLAQWVGPTSPTPDWQAVDANGRLQSQWLISRDFNQMFRDPTIGPDRAVDNFLTKYGANNLLLMQPNTEGYSPDSEAAYDFELSHPDLVRNYPDALRYWEATNDKRAPYEAYQRALDTGLRKPLSYRDWVTRANDRVGSMIYYNAKDQVGPRPTRAQSDWLTGFRTYLAQQFPGFDPEATDPKRRQRTIAQFYTASATGDLQLTSAGRGISAYLSARDQAIAAALQGGIKGWDSAKSARGIRNWLRGVADRIQLQHPEFSKAWEQVFQGEMVRDG